MAIARTVDRRTFLTVSAAAGGGLIVGGYLRGVAEPTASAAGIFAPNVWVRIAPDDTVTIMLSQLEMGQGVMTSMPLLVAEELDAD
jgi:isoquinoline 1-oxidoreductase beta subunit